MKSIKWTLVVPIIVALIGAAGIILAQWVNKKTLPTPTPSEISGRILSPRTDETVGRSFQITGELINIPDGEHVWLAIEIGNLMWIKEPEVPSSDRRWSRNIVEGGSPPGGRFNLCLLRVTSEGHHFILNWLDHGKKTGDYPGIAGIPGSSKLDIVSNLRLY